MSAYHRETERHRLKLGIIWSSIFLRRQDQENDRDHNMSNFTRPRTSIKNGVCVRIWILLSLVIPTMDSVDTISLFIFYIFFFS